MTAHSTLICRQKFDFFLSLFKPNEFLVNSRTDQCHTGSDRVPSVRSANLPAATSTRENVEGPRVTSLLGIEQAEFDQNRRVSIVLIVYNKHKQELNEIFPSVAHDYIPGHCTNSSSTIYKRCARSTGRLPAWAWSASKNAATSCAHFIPRNCRRFSRQLVSRILPDTRSNTKCQ